MSKMQKLIDKAWDQVKAGGSTGDPEAAAAWRDFWPWGMEEAPPYGYPKGGYYAFFAGRASRDAEVAALRAALAIAEKR